ncbi:hypothetical protein PC116_g33835 [Phytophthora cactorum]|nr:hypothetical protein PC116_g33835 [Phytophthora cactorum]
MRDVHCYHLRSSDASLLFYLVSVIGKADKMGSQWAHIGRIVFAASNDQLYDLTGPGNKENFTMDWHTRDVLKGCPQKDIQVIGPLEEEGKAVVKESDTYWSKTRANQG